MPERSRRYADRHAALSAAHPEGELPTTSRRYASAGAEVGAGVKAQSPGSAERSLVYQAGGAEGRTSPAHGSERVSRTGRSSTACEGSLDINLGTWRMVHEKHYREFLRCHAGGGLTRKIEERRSAATVKLRAGLLRCKPLPGSSPGVARLGRPAGSEAPVPSCVPPCRGRRSAEIKGFRAARSRLRQGFRRGEIQVEQS